MKECLVPYSRFENEHEVHELAEQLQALTRENENTLRARNIGGPIVRYAQDLDTAMQHIRKGQEEADPRHFAVINEAGNVAGAASIYKDLPLERVLLPTPPGLTPGLLKPAYTYARPNITAWTGSNHGNVLLTRAYEGMLELSRQSITADELNTAAWTIEPKKSPTHIHQAIVMSSLRYVDTGRYHDQESKWDIPPAAALYSSASYSLFGPKDMKKQLKSGGRQERYNRLSEQRKVKHMHYR